MTKKTRKYFTEVKKRKAVAINDTPFWANNVVRRAWQIARRVQVPLPT